MERIATHMPVLEMIKNKLNVKKVLELGCGKFSTKKFLEFPDLELLHSYEDDIEWFKKLNLKHKKLKLMLGNMVDVVKNTDLDFYDLIFVDCCIYPSERATVIREIVKKNPKALIVIHDFENELYQKEAKFKYKIMYDEFIPHTAILWNDKKWNQKLVQ